MKNKINGKRLRAVLIPLLIIITISTVALNIACLTYSYNMDIIFGAGEIKIIGTGAHIGNAEYYKSAYTSEKAVTDAMLELNTEIAAESVVLLKNNGALPLKRTDKKINVFGWSFENAPYCAPQSSSSSSSGDYLYPKQAFENAGYTLNVKLLENFRAGVPEYSGRPKIGRWNNDWALPEYVPTDAEISQAAEFSDVAVIWITRMGTEGADVPQSMNDNAFWHNGNTVKLSDAAKRTYGFDPQRHYLQLTATEERLLQKIIDEQRFKSVVAVINSDNPVELGFLRDSGIDAALLAGGMGFRGFEVLPLMFDGTIDPSGRLADTYVADFKSDPVWVNHGDGTGEEYKRKGILLSADVNPRNNVYTNLTPEFIAENGLRANDEHARFVFQNYEEGIYLGYAYYETAFGDNETEYEKRVIYPFGHGLSYTRFSQRLVKFEIAENEFKAFVEVTNIGDSAGKDVVQIYVTPPYGDKTTDPTKIEKPCVRLAGFAKTKTLGVGDSQTVTVVIDKELLTSYDGKTNKCYVLDDGDYEFTVRRNSHEPIKGQSYVWKNNARAVYDEDNPRPSEKNAHGGEKYRAATAAFDNTLIGISPEFTELSRADFAGTFPRVASDTDKTGSSELIEYFKRYDISKYNDENDIMPTTGADKGLQLIDLRGKAYDDPVWEMYLDQWNVDEMIKITSESGRGITENVRLGVPVSINSDGTMGIKYKSIDYTSYGTILPLSCTACCMARSWNVELCKRLGELCGDEALIFGMNGWYAPALNLHRSPLSGRYFDYFSEDPLLCGMYGAEIASGAGSRGVITYLKHFALNEGEYLRNYCSVWASEQAMRELYLKPFELAIKKSRMSVNYIDASTGETKTFTTSAVCGVMSSFNRVGNTWSGGNADLLQTVLRDEWGFCGVVITDNMRKEWTDMDLDVMLRGGGNIGLGGSDKNYADPSSASFVKALREAVHGICFTVVNSNAVNNLYPGCAIRYTLAPWKKFLTAFTVTAAAIVAGGAIFMIYVYFDQRKYPEKYDENSQI